MRRQVADGSNEDILPPCRCPTTSCKVSGVSKFKNWILSQLSLYPENMQNIICHCFKVHWINLIDSMWLSNKSADQVISDDHPSQKWFDYQFPRKDKCVKGIRCIKLFWLKQGRLKRWVWSDVWILSIGHHCNALKHWSDFCNTVAMGWVNSCLTWINSGPS